MMFPALKAPRAPRRYGPLRTPHPTPEHSVRRAATALTPEPVKTFTKYTEKKSWEEESVRLTVRAGVPLCAQLRDVGCGLLPPKHRAALLGCRNGGK